MDFKSQDVIDLRQCKISEISGKLKNFLVGGELILIAFTADCGRFIFTNKRIIYMEMDENNKGRLKYTSLPYSKVSSFSVENPDYPSSPGHLKFEFIGLGTLGFNVVSTLEELNLNKIISAGILC